jgi:uncharacterized membrane protein HdeD (DUF308 family)
MEKKRFSNWWFFGINGVIFTLFGLLVLLLDQDSIKTLLRYIGMVMLCVGGLLLLFGINSIRRDKAGAMVLVESIASIAIGIALLFFPQSSVALFLILTGIWAIMIGVIQLVVLINIKSAVKSKNLIMINGLLTVGLGISLLFNPFQWAVFLIKLIGFLAVVFGLILTWFAFSIRSFKDTGKQQ